MTTITRHITAVVVVVGALLMVAGGVSSQTPDGVDEVLLFDGECVLCDFSVNFVVRHDYWQRAAGIRLVPLQSKLGQRLLAEHRLPADIQSIVYIDRRADVVLLRSSAVAAVLRRMSLPWPVAGWLLWLLPTAVRDYCYDIVAANRYSWFGSKDMIASDGQCSPSDHSNAIIQRLLLDD